MTTKILVKRSRLCLGIFCFVGSLFICMACNTGGNESVTHDAAENSFTQRIGGEAQGTTYSMIYLDSLGRNFENEVDSILLNIDYSLSTYNPASLITLVNSKQATVKIVDTFGYFAKVFELSKKVFETTEGAFDPTVMPLVKAWGFGKKKVSEMDTSKIDSLLGLVGFNKVNLLKRDSGYIEIKKKDPRIQLDFNAIAQGYSVDVIANYFEKNGIRNFLIELGGEIISKGKNPKGVAWSVQLDKPVEDNFEREGYAKLVLNGEGLATSGNYRKFHTVNGLKVAHTINPKTGWPVQHTLLSATILASNAALADAYATAMMVMGTEKAKEFIESNQNLDLLVYFILGKKEGFDTFCSPNLENRVEKYKPAL